MNDTPKLIGHEKLMAIKKKLQGLPKMKRVKMYTPTEAVDALAGTIKALANKGYEPQEIVKLLEEEGLGASPTRVKKALSTPRSESSEPAPKRSARATSLNQENAARLQEALADELAEEPKSEDSAADQDERPDTYSKNNGKEGQL